MAASTAAEWGSAKAARTGISSAGKTVERKVCPWVEKKA
jgi:hypothetical protein